MLTNINNIKQLTKTNFIAFAYWKGDIDIFEFKIGKMKLVRQLIGHTDTVISFSWAEESKTLFSCGYDKSIKMWSITHGQCLKTFDQKKFTIGCMIPFVENNFIVSSTCDGKMNVVQISDGQILKEYEVVRSNYFPLLIWNDSKKEIITRDHEKIQIWMKQIGH